MRERRRLVRARWGGIGLIVLGVLAGTALLVAATPMGRYLARGAWAEARILARRRSITALVADSATAPAVRAKLRLVLEARAFAVDSLGLPAKDAFTQFT
ncbi:MAG: aminopeptidase, partial [Gemmatimonadetes bacterium]|nr:aminopeptidase [Gemmatimonadota bacterium]